ncbi:hypothetical protein QD47_17890 [Paenibacillus terrae]|uniref:Uncharacterized protein n=1 Tax=Paenibacillus terrae TaxID=159743 RepID=A0A0D7WYS0_9BACL|nr:hypothetical protein QD47_17890 [Paenibacillus terrae]
MGDRAVNPDKASEIRTKRALLLKWLNCFAAFSIRIILEPATPDERAGFIFVGIIDSQSII